MYLKRDIYSQMLDRKNNKLFVDKVLHLQGVRQAGKTYLVEKLGKEEFNTYI